MYINPFVLGVVATIICEIIAFVVLSLIAGGRK